jgi:hypothetical protein
MKMTALEVSRHAVRARDHRLRRQALEAARMPLVMPTIACPGNRYPAWIDGSARATCACHWMQAR